MKTSRAMLGGCGLIALVAALTAGATRADEKSDWWVIGKGNEASSTPTQQLEFKEDARGRTLSMTDWRGGNIAVRAAGSADLRSSANMAQARLMAEEAARAMAALRLAEVVQGVRIDSHTTVQDLALKSQTVNTSVSAFLKGIRYGEPSVKPQPDGSLIVEIAAGLGIFGDGGVLDAVEEGVSRSEGPKANVTPAPKPPEPYTGVIVDASGLPLRPGLAPRILTGGGHEVYGAANVPREYVIKQGMVGYAKSLEDAKGMADRVGKNPVVVKATGPDEKNGVSVVVTSEDAGKILRADEDGRALKEARVIFVLN